MHQDNEALLKEIHKAAASGLGAIETVLPKVRDSSLKNHIEEQGVCYQQLLTRSEKLLQKAGALPEKNPPLQKAMMWGAIQMETLADASSEHIAEMMINGSTMGVVEMTKQLHRLPEASSSARHLAEDFLSGEQRHIDRMKEHLRHG